MSGEYRTGTDRVAGIARTHSAPFFVDLQGDEIPVSPDLLTDLIEPFVESRAEMGTLKRALRSSDDLQNPAVVKVVTDRQGRALYFSRAPIPLVRDDPSRRVITSYSIHYTKLYEASSPCLHCDLVTDSGFRSVGGLLMTILNEFYPGHESGLPDVAYVRITSYNVCYTKLLRE